ncbi:TetR family transcriptional regulator [Hyphomicrobiales bacterium]|nr:TetR family transcriptional regulator [Hyphomicrobiales bacterium]CAH1691900.1 TetR family transcriptional regulator [Hyphomicrobiales bacterium]
MSNAWGLSNPTREELREQKREAVIQEAARAFRQKGFRATSMEDIAAALGVTKGALYRYVHDKHEILFECFKVAQHMSDAALETAQAHDGLGLAKLQVFFRSFIESFVAQGIAGTIMSDLDELKPEHRLEVIRGRDRIEHGLRKLISDGIDDGSIRPCRPKLAVFGLMGAVNWIPTWYSPEGEFKPAEIAAMMTDLFVNGLSAPE